VSVETAGGAARPPAVTRRATAAPEAGSAGLARNILALFAGLSLWTAIHFGALALLPIYLHE